MSIPILGVVSLVLVLVAQGCSSAPDSAPMWAPPPVNARVDYQLAGGYQPPEGVGIVTRDVTDTPASGRYGICYVNGFQTQAGARGEWPAGVVTNLEDPGWPGEFLVDISTDAKRSKAADFLTPQLQICADKGFQAVELDNLDSWTRLDDSGQAGEVPFGVDDAVAFASRLSTLAHARGLAVGQKNTPQLGRRGRDEAGFDFVVSEECGRYDECGDYTAVYGAHVIDIEYERDGFDRACADIGDTVSVVLRDRAVSAPGSATYQFAEC